MERSRRREEKRKEILIIKSKVHELKKTKIFFGKI